MDSKAHLYKKILFVTSVQAEKDAILRGLGDDPRFDVHIGGVGPVAAAVSTTAFLAKHEVDLVISAGIGGGFPEVAPVGSLVLSSEIIAADLGAQSPDGFISLDELGFGSIRVPVDQDWVTQLASKLSPIGVPVHVGPILTLSTVTGTAETTARLVERFQGASAEGMEGYGVAMAAHHFGIPVYEMRAISNAVGPRDRSAWRIKEALDTLEVASAQLREVL